MRPLSRHLRSSILALLALVAAAAAAADPAALASDGSGGLAPEPGPPASGSGAHANLRHSPGESAAFDVAATHGYTLHVESEEGLVTLIASRERPAVPTIAPSGRLLPANAGGVSESVYAVRSASRDPAVIRADFGRLGSIAVAFHPSGKRRVATFDLEDKTERCIGAARVERRLGAFVGTVSFDAENGYTAAELGRAPGTLGTSPYRNCTTLPSGSDQRRALAGSTAGPPAAALALHGSAGTSSLFAFVEATGSSFHVTQAQQLGDGLVVLRRAQAAAPAAAFTFDAAGTAATLRPPAPFSGSAAYSDSDHSPTAWAGDLSVHLPGLRVPLTGPAFDPPKLLLSTRSAGAGR